MVIFSCITWLVSYALLLIGSIMYFKRCRAPHAYTLLLSSITAFALSLVGMVNHIYVFPQIESHTLAIGRIMFYTNAVNVVAHTIFGIGFVLLIKRVVETQQEN
jgi:hypothetical protein